MMGLKGFSIFVIVAVIYLVQYTNSLPQDSSGIKAEMVSKNPELIKNEKEILNEMDSAIKGIPGRVSCPYEEATEDSSCQEHCLPKGYSYGICVSRTCSCI